MPGYRRDILPDDRTVHARLLCVICNLILRAAVQSPCGHRYCDTCLKEKLQRSDNGNQQPQCPACPKDADDGILNLQEIYPDFHARKELKTLQVKCYNNGCGWTGTFQQYAEHESQCEMEMIKCLKAGCGKSLRRSDLARHLEKDCPMRLVMCRNCREEIPCKMLKEHNSECPKKSITCEDCDQQVARDSLKAHKDFKTGNCPKKIQRCPFASCGCTFTISGTTGMSEHLQNEFLYHTQLQNDTFEELINRGNMLLESQASQLLTQSVISAGNAEGITNGEGASNFSSTYIDNLITIFKRWFVTRDEHGGTEPSNLKISGGNNKTSSPKTGRVSKQSEKEAVDKKVRQLESKVKESDQELQNMRTLYAVLDKRNETFQEVVAVLNNQLEALAERANTLERQNRHLQDIIEQQEKQINAHDQMLTVKNVALAEQELRIQSLEASAYNGILVWKISEFARRRRDAVSGKTTSFYSPAFYTSYHGYKMCARIYLNGDGMGKGTHISLFFVVMKGRYDNILRWPFRQKVTFMMVDQGNREHVVDSFRPDPTSSSFKKPTHEMNIASGCPLFVNLNLLESENHSFVKDDCLFVKVIVDVSDLERI